MRHGSVARVRPERRVSTLFHSLTVGARFGPSATGSPAKWRESPPPGLRAASLSGVLAVLDAPEQVGRARSTKDVRLSWVPGGALTVGRHCLFPAWGGEVDFAASAWPAPRVMRPRSASWPSAPVWEIVHVAWFPHISPRRPLTSRVTWTLRRPREFPGGPGLGHGSEDPSRRPTASTPAALWVRAGARRPVV